MPDSDADLEQEYAHAWEEWDDSGEAQAWESTIGDGLDDDPPCAESAPLRGDGGADG